jgi:D-glycero-D-manno-heptose 1,7-bisphosphate phosphatase
VIVAPPVPASSRALFLDRDGTLIDDTGYLGDPEGVRVLPGVPDALRALSAAGFRLLVVTNQSGIARGRYTLERYLEVAARVEDVLRDEGVAIEASYFCPYHPDGTVPEYAREHEDRKPGPGMWLRAAAERGIDLASSYSVGDGERDVVAGKRAGTTCVLLAGIRDKWPLPVGGPWDPDFVARDLREAALWILRREGRPLPRRPGDPFP